MATEKKISELDPATTLSETDVVPGNQGSSTKKISITVLRNVLNSISQTITGTLTATNFVGNGSGLTGIASGTGGVTNTGSTTIGADTDVNGTGEVAIQTRNITRLTAGNNGDLTAETGNIIIGTSGKGIDFDPAGSGSTKLLDDYEEGTFTPTVWDAETGGNQASIDDFVATYTKIGNRIYFTLDISNIDTAGLTAGNTIFIRGLPYSNLNRKQALVAIVGQMTLRGEGIAARIINGKSNFTLEHLVSNGNPAKFIVSDIASTNADIIVSGVYQT